MFFYCKAYTLRIEGCKLEELKKEGGGGVCLCMCGGWGGGGGGEVVGTFLNHGNIKIYRHLASISKQNPVDFNTNDRVVSSI